MPAGWQLIESAVRQGEVTIADVLQQLGGGFASHPRDDAFRPRDGREFGGKSFETEVRGIVRSENCGEVCCDNAPCAVATA